MYARSKMPLRADEGGEMIEAVLILISTASGVAMKAVWDAYVKKQQSIELNVWKLRADQLEKRLSEFYWPLYLRLQRDNVVWKKILHRDDAKDSDSRKLAYEIEKSILLPNHAEIVSVIEAKMHLADADEEFERYVMAYLRHVDVYQSSRAVGITDKDPIYFGEPYPQEFFAAVSNRLHKFQEEYDALLRRTPFN
jgi:hypothetical protein